MNLIHDVIFNALFALNLFGNVALFMFMVVFRANIALDKLIVGLAVAEVTVAVFGVPFTLDRWIGTPFKFGELCCRFFVPLVSACEIAEALLIVTMAVFVFGRLRGCSRNLSALPIVITLYGAAIVMTIPYFGVSTLKPLRVNNTTKLFCLEDWNLLGSRLFWGIKFVLEFLAPFCTLVYFNTESIKILRFVNHAVRCTKSARYQSFSKVTANVANERYEPHHVMKFSESEDMNLEMNLLYGEENEDNGKEEEKQENETDFSDKTKEFNIGVCSEKQEAQTGINSSEKRQLKAYRNEITLEKIDCHSKLWRGEKPDTPWRRENEFQKLLLSMEWYKYMKNAFYVQLVVGIVYLVCTLPNQILIIYSLFKPRYEFNSTERFANLFVLYLKLLPGLVNPWFFLLGVERFRKKLCKSKPSRRMIKRRSLSWQLGFK